MKTKYWSEPEQIDRETWVVIQYSAEDKRIGDASFKSKQDAWVFLKTINVYINENLVYSGI